MLRGANNRKRKVSVAQKSSRDRRKIRFGFSMCKVKLFYGPKFAHSRNKLPSELDGRLFTRLIRQLQVQV